MGQMGNQMFQYACALKLQKIDGFTCSLDDLSLLDDFKLNFGQRIFNRIKGILFFYVSRRIYGLNICNLGFQDLHQSYAVWLTKLSSPSMVWGFFQSEEYFLPIKSVIKRHFCVRKSRQCDFKLFLSRNKIKSGEYACIHIRRGDYKEFNVKGLEGNDFRLPLKYYWKAIGQLDKSLPVVVVSDDPSYCEYIFKEHSFLISKNDRVTDFLLLSNARQVVISNSTFSWWAAWLNETKEKVYCPAYFLGYRQSIEVPINIYPPDWIKLEFC
jgi:hypothetical protein